jgi:hypothetical protein
MCGDLEGYFEISGRSVVAVWLPLVNHRKACSQYPTTSVDKSSGLTVRTSDPWY